MEWKALAQTVPHTLELVDASVSEGVRYITEACVDLRTCTNLLGGMTDGMVATLPAVAPANPFESMAHAFREIAHHNELLGRAGRVFSLYGEHLGLMEVAAASLSQQDLGLQQPGHGMLWPPTWSEDRAYALHRAGKLPWTLGAAMSLYLASMDAMFMAFSWRPGDSPSWSAWRLASEQLAQSAELEAFVALEDEHQMRNAAVSEYLDALSILRIT